MSLCDVLRAAGLKLDIATMPTRDAVASYVLVEAANGYRAIFALAELWASLRTSSLGGDPLTLRLAPS